MIICLGILDITWLDFISNSIAAHSIFNGRALPCYAFVSLYLVLSQDVSFLEVITRFL